MVVIIIGTAIGFKRGLSGEIARFLGTIIALSLGLFFYKPCGAWISGHTRLGEESAGTMAFILTVTVILVITLVVRLVLRSIMKISFEGGLEKTWGCVAGFIRSVILVLIVFIAMNLWPQEYLNRVFGGESFIGSIVIRYLPAAARQVEKLPIKEKVEEVREKVSEKAK